MPDQVESQPTKTDAQDVDHAFVRQALQWLSSAEEDNAIAMLLDDFGAYLIKHFAAEESDSGLFAFVLDKAPHHASRVDQLTAEHALILDEIERIRALIGSASTGRASDALLMEVSGLTKLIGRHEHREQGLLQDALERDIGIGD